MHVCISEINETKVKEYYSHGYSIREIADKLSINPIYVYNIVVKGNKITTEEERAEMINLYNKGYSISAIAKIVGRSRACVRERIKSPAKLNCKTAANLTDKQIDDIENLAKKRKYAAAVSRKLGIKYDTVRCRLKRNTNVPKRTISKEEKELFIKLHLAGYTHDQIAEKCGRCVKSVGVHLRNAGYYCYK
jgi:DNA-directed RNA polymerase specialized sigma24 family protein